MSVKNYIQRRSVPLAIKGALSEDAVRQSVCLSHASVTQKQYIL